MSMLADRKRKQKWSLNPRGNEWSKDNNRFGQKLMERMGWKAGKGLGANEDGLTEHIRVAYKNDIKGIGFKESIEWSHQQDNFSVLLNELNSSNVTDDSPTTVKSLEEKSEKSRARVHYRKFTRGKDLSRYSEKDLANILGRRKLKTEMPVEHELEIHSELSSNSPQFGVNTTPGGSMVEYFKNKLPNFVTSFKNSKDESESVTESNYGFGFNTMETNSTNKNFTTRETNRKHDLQQAIPIRKSKKKRTESVNNGLINPSFDPTSRNIIVSKRHTLETITESDEMSPEPVKDMKVHRMCQLEESLNAKSEVPVKSKRKKHKRVGVEEINFDGINNPCFIMNSYETTLNISDDCDIKKKRKRSVENDELNKFTVDKYNSQKEIDTTDNVNHHKKSKSKRNTKQTDVCEDTSGCFNNQGFDNLDIIDNTNLVNLSNAFEIRTKKKKSKKNNNGIENPCFNIDLNSTCPTNDINNSDEFETKIKKSKKKKDKYGVDNLGFTTNSIISSTIAENQVKKPRKKDKARTDDVERSIEHEDFPIVGKIKVKHKKKPSEIEDCLNVVSTAAEKNGVDSKLSPTVAIEDPNVDDCDLILNITDEPVESKSVDVKKKNVQFSKVQMECLFEDFRDSPEDIVQRKDLRDINNKVIEASMARYKKLQGLDNPAFNLKSNTIEESINSLTRSLDDCQAEVENGINESKVTKVTYEERMVGELMNPHGEDEPHPSGSILRFKNANFERKLPYWQRQNYGTLSYPKKSYKHLIMGDIILGFKNSNLHNIGGYGKPFKNKMPIM